MKDGITQLMQLGLSNYEARAYVALLQQSPQNGYEIAKAADIPRANIYAVLRKLEERGAALRLDSPSGIRYSPVPITTFVQQQESRFKQILENTAKSLTDVARQPANEYVLNAHGYQALLENAQSVIDQTQEKLLLAILPPESLALSSNVSLAQSRGVEILSHCLLPCPPQTCGHCCGHIFRYAVLPSASSRWLVIVSDNTELLLSEISADDQALTIRTRQPAFVRLASWNIRTNVALAAVVDDLGQQLPTLLEPETKEILRTISPEGHGANWLEEMRDWMHGANSAETAERGVISQRTQTKSQ